MKFSLTTILFLAASASFTAASNLRKLSPVSGSDDDKACYEADLGNFGEVKFKLSSEGTELEIELENLDALATAVGSELNPAGLAFHVHTIWDNLEGSYAVGDSCGGSNTGLHYDPTLKCGGASEGKSTLQCAEPGVGYDCSPSNPTGCEAGDFSGIFGKISITDSELEAEGGAADQVKATDYVEDNTVRVINKWSSIVFHGKAGEGQAGARVLCGKFVEVDC